MPISGQRFVFCLNNLTFNDFRHAIHMFWQLKTYRMFEDMQHQIFLLDIQLRIIFGSCEIPASSSAVVKETYGFFFLASAV